MEAKDVYPWVISNVRSYIERCAKLEKDESCLNAFDVSSVLAVAFCKTKEDVIVDILGLTSRKDAPEPGDGIDRCLPYRQTR